MSSTINQITRCRVAASVLHQVIAAGNDICRGAGCKPFTGVPLVAGDDRVGQCEGWNEATAKLADEERGGSPVWGNVVGDGRVGDCDVPISLEDGTAMPTSGSVATDGAVRDGHIS